MNNRMSEKEYKGEYEYSELFIHIDRTIISNKGVKWRKGFFNAIFDNELTRNDLVVYLSILKENYFLDQMWSIRQNKLVETTRIKQSNIGSHTSKLVEKGYIDMKEGFNFFYSVKEQNGKFLSLTKEHFKGLSINKKLYIDTLRLIVLSSGNDTLPPMENCKKRFPKMEKRYYKVLKDLRQGRSDVQLYESLKDLKVVQPIITSSLSESVKMDLVETTPTKNEVEEVFNFMNDVFGRIGERAFKPKDFEKITLKVLQNNSIESVLGVISNRFERWDNDTMRQHLNPSTIFRSANFNKYLDDFKDTKIGQTRVNTFNLNLKHNEEFTTDNTQKLINTDTYNLFEFRTDKEGNKKGAPSHIVRYGKDITRLINAQEFSKKINGVREYLYYYNALAS
jgi:uncharacterized phage protein (TIGR02220 family)